MNQSDKRQFANLLNDLAEIYDKPEMSAVKLKAYWLVLEKYPLSAVEKGIELHLADQENGKRMARPADLVTQIRKTIDLASGRPSADEAWALALKASDENETVVWTDEIGRAYSAAYEILSHGDKIGARMAFKAAYERESELATGPAVWTVSLGHDSQRRDDAISEAIAAGRLSADSASRYLPYETSSGPIAGLLAGNVVKLPNCSEVDKNKILESLGGIKKIISSDDDYEPVEISEDEEKSAQEKMPK